MEWKLLFVALIRSCKGIFEGFAEPEQKELCLPADFGKALLAFPFMKDLFIVPAESARPAYLKINQDPLT